MSKVIPVKLPSNPLCEPNGCGVNAILTCLAHIDKKESVSQEEVMEIFDQNDEGIAREAYRFNKLNQLLQKKGVDFKLKQSRFKSKEELLPQLRMNFPVPVYMDNKILKEIKKHFKTEFRLQLGEIFQGTLHVLLIVGMDDNNIHCLDPSYQLPWIQKGEDIKNHIFTIPIRLFFENVKGIKTYIEIKGSKKLKKRLKGQGIL